MHNSLIRFWNRMSSLSISCAKQQLIQANQNGDTFITDRLIIVPHHLASLGYISSFTTNKSDTNPGITEDSMVSYPLLRSTIIATSKLLMPIQNQCLSRTHSSFVISTSLNLVSRQMIASFMRSTRLNLQYTTCQQSIVNRSSKQLTTCIAYSKPVNIPRPQLLPILMTYLC